MAPFPESTICHASALCLSRIHRNDFDIAFVNKQVELPHDGLTSPGLQDNRCFDECGSGKQALVISKNQINEMRALRLVEKDGHQS